MRSLASSAVMLRGVAWLQRVSPSSGRPARSSTWPMTAAFRPSSSARSSSAVRASGQSLASFLGSLAFASERRSPDLVAPAAEPQGLMDEHLPNASKGVRVHPPLVIPQERDAHANAQRAGGCPRCGRTPVGVGQRERALAIPDLEGEQDAERAGRGSDGRGRSDILLL